MATNIFAPIFGSLLSLQNPTATAPTPYENTVKFIQNIAQNNPQNAQLITIGDSDSGQKIYALKVGDGPVHNIVVATHHGNEYGSTEVAKAFAQSIAQNPIQGQTVYVIPVLNVSGYNKGNRYETVKNAQLDPNRNYPGPCGTEGPFTLKSTRALAQFIEDKNIVASATLHTFAQAVLYPWGISTQDLSTPYDSKFIELGNEAAQYSKYTVGNSTALLYAADGTYEDYAFWKHGVWSLLFEMGTSHSPSPNQVKKMIAENVPGLRKFLERAPSTKAENHDFAGKCDTSRSLPRRVNE